MAEIFHRYIGKDGKLPKIPPAERRQQARRNELAAELTNERARAVRANRLRSEMLLAKARGELIEKALVEKQAAWLFIAFRQRFLSVPQAYTRQLLGITDAHVMSKKLREMALSLLAELQHMPAPICISPVESRRKPSNLLKLASRRPRRTSG
jgi:hypothetical protein